MMEVERRRAAFIALPDSGKRPNDIFSALQNLNVKRYFAYKNIKRYNEEGTLTDRER